VVEGTEEVAKEEIKEEASGSTEAVKDRDEVASSTDAADPVPESQKMKED
jgi:hypothetical protein